MPNTRLVGAISSSSEGVTLRITRVHCEESRGCFRADVTAGAAIIFAPDDGVTDRPLSFVVRERLLCLSQAAGGQGLGKHGSSTEPLKNPIFPLLFATIARMTRMKRYVLLFLFNILVVTGFTSGAQACISKLPIRTFEGIGTEKLSWTYSQFAAHFGEDLGPLLNVVSKAADGSTVRVREAILFPDSEEKRVVLRWGASEYIASMIVSEGSSRRVFEKAIDTGIRVGVDVKQLVGNSQVTAQTISSTGLVTARYIDDFCVVGGWVLTFQVNPRQASGVSKALSKSGEVPPQARIKKPYGKITGIELKIRGSKSEPW